ncbi:ABC transporter ATP-binding protein [Sanguibacter sp. HDW7]|uniref:ABC transporter ATP-binding protein n=1 Tax=Sanguibacter sp. HDW7 TaxID=2714931 RepID=UPI00140DF413|nr:ATP-binding cassette domain-containing protein [Sanguibacter sp. HDW7]QIK84520.1 ATP-binding cassette domain-containing protein [Sanguibacter sp. HDW7]
MEVQVEQVSIAFGDVHVVDDFDAVFAPGRVTALVGPSGSGKSTILAAVAGFLRPRSGRIVVVGDDGTPGPPHPRHVGWVAQGANALGARTVRDNVMIGALGDGLDVPAAAAAADTALAQVGLTHRADALARTLSGGELQRTAFARALATRRPLVLADEPTSSLDAAATQTIIDLLRGLRSDATVVVATHDPAVIEAAQDRVDMRTVVTGRA